MAWPGAGRGPVRQEPPLPHLPGGAPHRAPFTLAITGTPLENSLGDLWSMFSLAAPGLFPRLEGFTENYRKPVERNGETDVLGRLRARIRPFMLRRTKREVVRELPEKVEQVTRLELTPAHRRRYDQHLTRGTHPGSRDARRTWTGTGWRSSGP